MNIKLLASAIAIIICLNVNAQEAKNKISIGTHIAQYQDNLGIGLNLTTPYFLREKVALRIGATTGTQLQNDESMHIGITYTTGWVNENIRLYTELGIMQYLNLNGYGTLGIELYPKDAFNYFVEFGGIGGNEISTLTNVGMRLRF